MELLAIVFILGAGGALAIFVMTAMAIARREQGRAPVAAPSRDSVAASILVHVVAAGGMNFDEAVRSVRRGAGLAAPVTFGIDVANWAESYARQATPQQRSALLETAVQLVASPRPIPLLQYAALLDLSFGLGFQTDALARLRERYGFEYIDPAKDARPKGADRAGDAAPLFVRVQRKREELLRVLGIADSNATRQDISAAYRKLVTQHHPDRFHGASNEAQSAAAARFIEITRAYEELLLTDRE